MNQEIPLEKIVDSVVREVIRELHKKGVKVVMPKYHSQNRQLSKKEGIHSYRNKTETIDMGVYKTPILTENHIQKLHELTGEVIVPQGTVITPKARELIQTKQILVTMK